MMSKRQEIRDKRRRERMRSQILVVLFVVAGALLLAFALVMPTVQGLIDQANATEIPVTMITPRTFNSPVDGASHGDPNAPVKMDTWEDFQCPACVGFSQSVMPQIISTYVDTGRVYYTFHFYPFIDNLSATQESDQAASASLCASEQGRFWDYHDILFANWNGENQGAYADARLVRFAEVLGLDMDAFSACFEEGRYQNDIDRDFALGETAGVNSTPTIFVNGVRVLNDLGEQYVPDFGDVAAAIEAALGGE
ncbi:MAG: thioredoxin domain-containing protein [Chloroflexota bacterium]